MNGFLLLVAKMAGLVVIEAFLSIPLNGFTCLFYVTLLKYSLIAFNSIEWIPLLDVITLIMARP